MRKKVRKNNKYKEMNLYFKIRNKVMIWGQMQIIWRMLIKAIIRLFFKMMIVWKK